MIESPPVAPPKPVSGDTALDGLVRRYLPVVYAAARRQLPDSAAAEDVAQAVFIVLARRYDSLPADVVLSSWLLKVTHLACMQARRNAARRIKHERKAAQMRSTTVAAEEITTGQLTAELDAALSRLRDADRSVLTLRYLEQKSVAEVAEKLGISIDAAQKRIDRAMVRLRKKLRISRGQVAAGALGMFFLVQSQRAVPPDLAQKVTHAMITAKTATTATSAGAISQGVLKTMYWSSVKAPVAVAAALVITVGGAVMVEQAISRQAATPMPASRIAALATPAGGMRPATSNVRGAEDPRVDDQRHASFRIFAPDAAAVWVEIGDTFDMMRDKDGYWSVTTPPLAPGFHYYQIGVDGAAVGDPGSETYFGVSKMMSGVEVPDSDSGFYQEQNVPHGDVRVHVYHSARAGVEREAYVYLPPGYDTHPGARYPVIYLLNGVGEDQRAWVDQGKVNVILDNLIAQGKAKEMIAVSVDAGTGGGFGDRGFGGRGRGDPAGSFATSFIMETVPMIDATYRTIADRDHRAIAGVSLGGMQSLQVAQDNRDKFAYVGSFSSPFGPQAAPGGGMSSRTEAFARQAKLVYISTGADENSAASRMLHDQLNNAEIAHVYFESPGNAHGWETWRKSLRGMAPLLFQN